MEDKTERVKEMLIFKYLSPNGAKKVLEHETQISLRFGLPSLYNDPYELFLQTDQPFENQEIRAFFDYFLGEIIEAPVTCFSRSPDSVVMWAHYGREGTGICLGYDEDALADQFSIAYIEDVTYSNEPATIDYFSLQYAYETGKRRHSLYLMEKANRAAFFIKRDEWQYEQERRMVVLQKDISVINNLLIAKLDPSVLRYIIIGANVNDELHQLCQDRAKQFNIPLVQQKNGKRNYQPYFYGTNFGTFTWDDGEFKQCPMVCKKCKEPAEKGMENGICQWCSISDEMRSEESARSMFKSTLQYGADKGLPFRFAGLEPKGQIAKHNN